MTRQEALEAITFLHTEFMLKVADSKEFNQKFLLVRKFINTDGNDEDLIDLVTTAYNLLDIKTLTTLLTDAIDSASIL